MSTFPPLSSRRQFLTTTAIGLFGIAAGGAKAASYSGSLPWRPNAASPPNVLPGGRWYVFTPDEARTVEAIVDRLIPADDLSIGGKEAGCASFIDRQLAGSFGSSERLYMQGPFQQGLPTQGYQGSDAPLARYKKGLAALADHVKAGYAGKAFADLTPADQDKVLKDFEGGKIAGFPAAAGFFNLLLQNTMEGFFSDPIYGGNKGMAGWTFIGFPGARYDYRDYITQHNKPFPLPPVSIAGRADWTVGK